jgi:tRNA-2-methylthio-N6-dimethylallyladenosine synthase
MDNQVPKEVVQERFERLVALQNDISWQENKKQLGKEVEVLVAQGEGKKDIQTQRMSGRCEDSRLVHFDVPENGEIPRPGDIVTVTVTEAAPFHLIAGNPQGVPLRIRRTRAGDAWDRDQAESCGTPLHTGGAKNLGSTSTPLGMPTLKISSPLNPDNTVRHS